MDESFSTGRKIINLLITCAAIWGLNELSLSMFPNPHEALAVTTVFLICVSLLYAIFKF